MPITKKYVEIKIEDKVVAILPICECTPHEFLAKKKEASDNFNLIVNGLIKRVDELEKEVKILKGEDEEEE